MAVADYSCTRALRFSDRFHSGLGRGAVHLHVVLILPTDLLLAGEDGTPRVAGQLGLILGEVSSDPPCEFLDASIPIRKSKLPALRASSELG